MAKYQITTNKLDKQSNYPLLDYIWDDELSTEAFNEWLDGVEPTEEQAIKYLNETAEDYSMP